MSGDEKRTVASAPGKINVALHVGSPDASGFHPLLTAFQAVDMSETVTVTTAPHTALECHAPFDTGAVPRGPENLAWRAIAALEAHCGVELPTAIHIDKVIPVAGGMAGGSADAAATLVAVNEHWRLGVPVTGLYELARSLGSDVPFSLLGGAAVGRGRGDVLEGVTFERELWWVIVPSTTHLSTPAVYKELDVLRGDNPVSLPDRLTDDFLSAWREADARRLAPLMHNDLEQAALRLAPELAITLQAVSDAGALRAMVSGSGPTVLGLAESEQHARYVATELESSAVHALVTCSTPRGARLHPSRPG